MAEITQQELVSMYDKRKFLLVISGVSVLASIVYAIVLLQDGLSVDNFNCPFKEEDHKKAREFFCKELKIVCGISPIALTGYLFATSTAYRGDQEKFYKILGSSLGNVLYVLAANNIISQNSDRFTIALAVVSAAILNIVVISGLVYFATFAPVYAILLISKNLLNSHCNSVYDITIRGRRCAEVTSVVAKQLPICFSLFIFSILCASLVGVIHDVNADVSLNIFFSSFVTSIKNFPYDKPFTCSWDTVYAASLLRIRIVSVFFPIFLEFDQSSPSLRQWAGLASCLVFNLVTLSRNNVNALTYSIDGVDVFGLCPVLHFFGGYGCALQYSMPYAVLGLGAIFLCAGVVKYCCTSFNFYISRFRANHEGEQESSFDAFESAAIVDAGMQSAESVITTPRSSRNCCASLFSFCSSRQRYRRASDVTVLTGMRSEESFDLEYGDEAGLALAKAQ